MKVLKTDPEVYSLIQKEQQRQREQLQMIPSENYVSKDVLGAVGSILMNKYSEGQPFKRYYQGNNVIDQIEGLVKERALHAFGLNAKDWGVNVQAMNGSIANLAVYLALLEPGDKLLSMMLFDGGHLSHGWQLPNGKKISASSRIFQPSFYSVAPKSKLIDYSKVKERAYKEKPKMIISGGTSYPREIDHQKMREVADEVGAYYLADIAHEAGLVLAGVNKSPFPYAHVVTMTTRKTLRGPIGAIIFAPQENIQLINQSVFPGLQGGPQNHSIAGIGVALHEAIKSDFTIYAKQMIINAKILAAELANLGFTIVSGGTDKHLFLIDLTNKQLPGKEAALALEKANIIVNKNAIPSEPSSLWNPSGIRLGSPALTSRGMKEAEMKKIAHWIKEAINKCENEESLIKIGKEVKNFALHYPVPGLDD